MEQPKEEITRIDSYEFDERFYQKIVNKEKFYQPSVTYILGCAYPSNFGLTSWRGDVGNKRAEEILDETAEDGSFVHQSIQKLILQEKVSSEEISSRFKPKRSLKIKRCLKAFLDWVDEYKPTFINSEYIIWTDQFKYAGTVDCFCRIGEQFYLVDFKTSKSIHTSHKLQVVAYAQAEPRPCKCALLHLGNTTKKGYSFLELDEDDTNKYWSQFLSANNLFQSLYPEAKPTSQTFPDYFKIETKK